MSYIWQQITLWMLLLINLLIRFSEAGISYQSVSFVHNPPKIRQFHPIHPPHNSHISHPPHPLHIPPISSVNFFENNLQHTFGDELWPASIFDEPVDFLDITLDNHHPHHPPHHIPHPHPHHEENHIHNHDFINELGFPPDPFLLTGYRAKQAADYLYSHELFFKDIPHAKALLKLQEKRLANGLRPNRLGSINIRSPFNRDHAKHYPF